MGVSVADYDNDGFDDLFITCFGPNRLPQSRRWHFRRRYARQESETHASQPAPRGEIMTAMVISISSSPVMSILSSATYRSLARESLPVQDGPCAVRTTRLPGAGDKLYHNNGNGTFTEVSKKAGVDDPNGYYGLGVMWTDFDNDGWPDIFVANDATPNFAYRNNHDGTFTDMALPLGLAVDENGVEQGSMGISIGDYDRDGRLDLVVTNFADQYNTIYHQNTDGTYNDVSRSAGLAESWVLCGWGVKFFDFDNDGWLDLLIVNGHVYPQIEGAYPGGLYKQRALLYRNLRNGKFEDISTKAGQALTERRVGRGAAFGDYDEDGDIDVIVNDLDGPPMLLRNDGGSKAGHWISLKLVGKKSNRNAVGARVELTAGGLKQIDEVHAGDSYLSHSDWRLHFGLGTATTVDEVSIRWPSGVSQKLTKLPIDRVMTIEEAR